MFFITLSLLSILLLRSDVLFKKAIFCSLERRSSCLYMLYLSLTTFSLSQYSFICAIFYSVNSFSSCSSLEQNSVASLKKLQLLPSLILLNMHCSSFYSFWLIDPLFFSIMLNICSVQKENKRNLLFSISECFCELVKRLSLRITESFSIISDSFLSN